MTSAYLYQGELRVYNRNNTVHRIAKTDNEEKALLKKLGFTWDKFNKSYFLKDASPAVINAIESKVLIIRR